MKGFKSIEWDLYDNNEMKKEALEMLGRKLYGLFSERGFS